MRFESLSLRDAMLVHTELHKDDRGHFARLRCSREFAEAGLPDRFVQTNLSFNRQAGTFRGLHFQVPPSQEGKLVRCIAGMIDDVIVDLRSGSPSFLRHEWVRLSAEESTALFVPSGFAHGFLTRTDNTTVLYEMTDWYDASLSAGLRWSDPTLGISLPGEIQVINDRDAAYPYVDSGELDVLFLDPGKDSAD